MISTTCPIGTPSSRPSTMNASTPCGPDPTRWLPSGISGDGAGFPASCDQRLGVEDQNGGRVSELGGSRHSGDIAQQAADRLDHDLAAADESIDDDPDRT